MISTHQRNCINMLKLMYIKKKNNTRNSTNYNITTKTTTI